MLGIVWKRGPCTIYAVTKELSDSTSAFYKERASTVYPVADRLLSQGLIEHRSAAGTRQERSVAITESGIEAVEQWLLQPIKIQDSSHTVDLIRLRVFYLGTLSPDDRKQFLETALESLHEHLENCKKMIENYQSLGDTFSVLATQGVVYETLARIQWLDAISEELLNASKGRPNK